MRRTLNLKEKEGTRLKKNSVSDTYNLCLIHSHLSESQISQETVYKVLILKGSKRKLSSNKVHCQVHAFSS